MLKTKSKKISKLNASNKKLSFTAFLSVFLMVVVLFLFSFSFSFADISKTVNYQGKITTRSNGILLADGTYDMRFKIYDALTEGNLLWTGTHTTSNGNPISVNEGIFSVLLGSGSGNTLDLDFSTNSYYLEVSIYNTDTTSWEDFSPRKQIASVPQAYNANSLIGNGNINLSNTSTSQDAAVITYNPTSGSNDALEVVYGSGGGSGTALKVTQSGSGDILRLYDDSNQVFTVLDGGNVGIGTSSPESKLDIGGVAGNFGTLGVVSDSNHKALNIEENSGGESWQIGVNSSGDLAFMDSNADIANASLVIQDGGNVGIGTTNPTATLDIVGNLAFTDSSGNQMNFWKDTTSGLEHILRLQSSAGNPVTNGRTILSIDAPSSNPKEATLGLVLGDEVVDLFNQNETAPTNKWGLAYIKGTETSSWRDFTIQGQDGFGGSIERYLTIELPGGNVGIGTSDPDRTLDVNGSGRIFSSGGAYLELFGAGDGYNFSALKLSSDEATDKYWQIGHRSYSGEVNNLSIEEFDGSNYNQRFIIEHGGNVGIGTSDPDYKLQVAGTLGISGQFTSTLATGTAPFAVASTTLNTNLNADLLDGNDATAFATSSHTHSSLTQGNGITSFTYNGGSAQTVALGNLTSNWSQAGAYDIVLGNGTFDNTSASADLYATGNIEADGTIYGTFSGSGASLTGISESSISDGSLLARVAGTETISGGWTFTSEPTLSGSGRHLRQMRISPEYTGAVLTAFYGSGTDTSINGTMTSDTEPSADSLRTYYEWSSSQSSLNHYTVAIRVALPSDFSAWATSNAVQVDFDTESTSTSDNFLGVYIYNGDDTPGTAVASSTSNASSVADTWTTVSIDDSEIDDDSAPDWDNAEETAVIYLRMGSLSDNFVRIGDIKLNYLSKW